MNNRRVAIFTVCGIAHLVAYFPLMEWGKWEWLFVLYLCGPTMLFGQGLQAMRAMSRGHIGRSSRTATAEGRAQTEASFITVQYLTYGLPIPFLWAAG
jgi:hypothetical protein